MYAVISAGATQQKVAEGEQVNVDLLDAEEGDEVALSPVLLVDGDTVLATRRDLANVVVKARVVGDARGPKIDGFVYKPKSNNRRRYGHRQNLSVLEITAINKGRSRSRSTSSSNEPAAETEAEAGEES